MQSVKNDKPAERSEYPCLKQCTSSGTVVLFSTPNDGVVVCTPDDGVVVWSPEEGLYLARAVGEKYVGRDDADSFVPFTGTITLQN